MTIPAVYVTIEDQSVVLPGIDSDRTVFCAILGDRGPHNRVVELTSVTQFYKLFGKPDFDRTGYGHYLVDKALQMGASAYVVRAAKLDSDTEEYNAALANCAIKFNDLSGSFQMVNGNFLFANEEDIHSELMAKRVYVDLPGFDQYEPGDLIISSDDGETPTFAATIYSKHQAQDGRYYFVLEEAYEGTSTEDQARELLYHGNTVPIDNGNNERYRFIENSTALVCDGAISQDALTVGMWVYPSSGNLRNAREIVDIPAGTYAAQPQIEKLHAVDNENDVLNNRYFFLNSPGTDYYVWFDVNNTGIDPAPAGKTGVEVNLLSGDDDVAVAMAINTAIDSLADFTAVFTDTVITISNNTAGECDTISDPATSAAGLISEVVATGTNPVQNVAILADQYASDTSPAWEEATNYDVGDFDNLYTNITSDDTADSIKWYPGGEDITDDIGLPVFFDFTEGSNIVVANSEAAYNSVSGEDWIFPSLQDVAIVRQIITKQQDEDTGVYQLVLDEPFAGATVAASAANSYVPLEIISNANIRGETSISTTDADNMFHFYANGVGTYYNKLYMVGVRNVGMEKLFTDNDGVPLYKYAFMDLYLYEENIDGSSTLLEGPWSVSLINKTKDGQIVRNLNTGQEMYITSVVNRNSDIFSCKEAQGADLLLNDENAETLRLQALSLFAVGSVKKTDTRGQEGFYFENGEDGIQYDSQDRLNIYHGEIEGLVMSAFNGTLLSTDGTIELLVQDIYGWYYWDYTLAGGYSPNIQNAARQLADNRFDCLVLGDTGYTISAEEDLNARLNSVPWNTWNAMLYTQYRQIFDQHTGKDLWMTPVYHAIERHLFVDAQYWIAEPVAGIEKGAISEPIELTYKPNLAKMEDMIDAELNPILVEPQGKYILTQFTTWKRLSAMKRAHVVKFVQYVKKEIPKLLKDLLQRKATPYWIGQADSRCNNFLSPFLIGASPSEKYIALKSFEISTNFDDMRQELNVFLKLDPVDVIEVINVRIIVV
mgnify:CR=1 FL=1|jgi:hypothetical protein